MPCKKKGGERVGVVSGKKQPPKVFQVPSQGGKVNAAVMSLRECSLPKLCAILFETKSEEGGGAFKKAKRRKEERCQKWRPLDNGNHAHVPVPPPPEFHVFSVCGGGAGKVSPCQVQTA